jgi:hypothetical protein
VTAAQLIIARWMAAEASGLLIGDDLQGAAPVGAGRLGKSALDSL